ncbi:hypothetical protein WS87_13210 [Burkholderia sp. MSMB0856]|nr:hypothetical protein WS87_13210 [Burkholderia sp. MSMB0856]KVH30895.1 hypothetical protein WS87_26235 [Burkholderia sp. MSMB0856]
MQSIPSDQIAIFGDRCQLLIMHDQHALHVGQFVSQKGPRLAAFSTRNTGVQNSFRSPIQI